MFPLYVLNNLTTDATLCYRHDGKSGLLAFQTRRVAAEEARQRMAVERGCLFEIEEITNNERLEELLSEVGEQDVWVVTPDTASEPMDDGQHKHGKR